MRRSNEYYCPICKTMIGRPIAHFKKFQDDRHEAIYDSQIKLIVELFKNLEFTKLSTTADYGVMFHYNFVKEVWASAFTQRELTERAEKARRFKISKTMSKNHFKVTDETKRKMSEAKMGNIPWNKGTSKKKEEDDQQ